MSAPASVPQQQQQQPPPPPTPTAKEIIVIVDSDSELSDLEGYDTDPERRGATVAGDGDLGDLSEGDPDDPEAWETESLLEDMLEELATDGSEPDSEEFSELRSFLKNYGDGAFVDEIIHGRGVSARRCITAFNVRPPSFLENADDGDFLPLLRVILRKEMTKRSRLPHVSSVEHVVELLKKSEQIVVLTGAGISTSLGIPDFRSKGSGLYSRLEGLGLTDPQEVFDIEVFNDDPTTFYSIAKDILPNTKQFSPTHAFIVLLQSKKKLLTQYTQNIDNLENCAGILPDKLIQCHGSFATASCVKCKNQVPGENIFPELRRGVVAKCDACLKQLAESSAAGKKRKRSKSGDQKKKRFSEDSSAEEEEMNFREAGVMKPDITFFGEQLPDTFHKRLFGQDRDKVDLLICIGTSLKVAPVSEIIGFLPKSVPQIYISKTPVNHVEFDVELLGSCDEVVAELCKLAGWDLEHEMIPKSRPEVEWRKVDGPGNRYEYASQAANGTVGSGSQ